MARVTANLSVQAGNKGYNFSFSKPYNVLYTDLVHLTRSTSFTSVLDITVGTRGKAILREGKFICLQNNSNQPVEIQLKYSNTNAGGDPDAQNGSRSHAYTMQILMPNQFLVVPNSMITASEATTSLAVNTATSSATPTSNKYVDSTVNLAEKIEDTLTDFDVSDSDFMKVGDYIQIGINDTTATRIEVMRITAISGNNLTVDRALFGTSKADGDAQTDATNGAVSGANVHFPIFTTTKEYDKYSTVQTDNQGRYSSTNFFGLGRTADKVSSGIVRGSVKIGFYNPAYQGFGLHGINATTEHGLATSTTYTFGLALDGGSARDIAVTTDATNKTIGSGANNLIEKIQTVIDSFYNTAGDNLFEKKAIVEIRNGDLVIRSGSRLSTSAVAISDASGTDPWSTGLFPAFASLPTAVAPTFPPNTVDVNGNEDANMAEALFDDGMGNLVSPTHSDWSGSIDYSSGKINFTAYPNSNFKISAYTGSMLGGQNTAENTLVNISARSTSAHRDASVSVVACD